VVASTTRQVLGTVVVLVALAWAAIVLIGVTRYHINEPVGMTAITTNGHTYYGDPPALTLFERDPTSFVFIAVALGLGLITAVVDLAVRKIRRLSGVGLGAIIAGVVLIVLSLLGLLFGLATVGVDGALLVLAGLILRRDDHRAGGPNSRSPASPSPGVM
jgi:small-conductance mechanosensitive channel